MKIHLSISETYNGSVVIHDGDTIDLPWRFRELVVFHQFDDTTSDLPRCSGKLIKAITFDEASKKFWSSIRSR